MANDTDTVREHLHQCYARLASAHAALDAGRTDYARIDHIIRSRLLAGLRSGSMSVRSLFHDERQQLSQDRACVYCGASDRLTLDHLIARSRCADDSGYNLVPACRPCNSSKGARDLLGWYRRRDSFPPLLLYRRYLKLAMLIAEDAGVAELAADAPEVAVLPFPLLQIPRSLPPLSTLHL